MRGFSPGLPLSPQSSVLITFLSPLPTPLLHPTSSPRAPDVDVPSPSHSPPFVRLPWRLPVWLCELR